MIKQNSHTYQITNEVFNSITHGIATLLAIAGTVLLILKGVANGSAIQIVSFSIYGAALTLLFLFSTLRHSLYFTRASAVFQVFDHNGIFLLIAGTYTPYCLVAVRGWLGWTVWGVIVACAVLGIIFTSIFLPRVNKVPKFSTVLYVIMGWMILAAIYPLWQALGHTGFWLLVAGGVVYSIGALFYHFKFPYTHVVWHLFVMIAAFLMWLSIYGFVG